MTTQHPPKKSAAWLSQMACKHLFVRQRGGHPAGVPFLAGHGAGVATDADVEVDQQAKLLAAGGRQRGHAVANGCFVAAINRTGFQDDTEFWGQSFVANPYGELIAKGSVEREEIVHTGIKPEDLDEGMFAGLLATAGSPPPDIIVRPSGEQRLSNFLLWEAAYAELVFQDVYWPDYGADNLKAAIAEFRARERRYGGAASDDVLAAG